MGTKLFEEVVINVVNISSYCYSYDANYSSILESLQHFMPQAKRRSSVEIAFHLLRVQINHTLTLVMVQKCHLIAVQLRRTHSWTTWYDSKTTGTGNWMQNYGQRQRFHARQEEGLNFSCT